MPCIRHREDRVCGVTRFPWPGLLVFVVTLTLGPASPAVEPVEVQDLLRTGQYAEAAALAAEATQNPDASEVWYRLLIQGLLAQGDYPGAREAATNAMARHGQSLRIRWLARDTALAIGDTNAAKTLAVEIVQRAGNQAWAYQDAASLVVVGRAALTLGADPKQVLDRLYDPAKRAEPALRDVYLASGELALEKHDDALAAREFREGLEKQPNDPDLLCGLARAYADSEQALMIQSLETALNQNSNHVASLLLLAEHSIDAERYEQADELLDRVLAVNPWEPDAWALRAVIQHLANDPDAEVEARETALKYWASNPRVDHLIGLKLSQKYRFTEGALHQYAALRFDPTYVPAKAQLAQDLLRLGREEEGWRLADAVQREDGYDVVANNLMTLKDVVDGFVTLTNNHFVVRMESDEAALYGRRALGLLETARESLCARYGMELPQPTLVEIFHEQKDFAVRTFGLPGHEGFLGVCFGSVITANSPGARGASRFNWESMLWHEFCHVVTLQMTGNKMPRWLSEGISVYEERQANPAWGEKLNPRYREMLLGDDLTPVSQLSGAFLVPRSGEHLQFAYYQSSLVVEFLVDRFGFDALVAVLHELRTGTDINAAIERHTAPMAEIEAEFEAFAHQTAEQFGPGLDWERPELEDFLATATESDGDRDSRPFTLDRLLSGGADGWTEWAATRPSNYWVLTRNAQQFVEEENWEEARPVLEELINLCPEVTGPGSAYALLGRVYQAEGEVDAERNVLLQLAERDDEALDAYRRLMELGTEAGDWPLVQRNAQRYLGVDPLVALPHRFLAQSAMELGELELAAEGYRALLQLDPPNPAEVHFQLASVLYELGDPEARRQVLQALEEAPRYREALQLLLKMNETGIPEQSRVEERAEDGARVCDPQQGPQREVPGTLNHQWSAELHSSSVAVRSRRSSEPWLVGCEDGSALEYCCGSQTRGPVGSGTDRSAELNSAVSPSCTRQGVRRESDWRSFGPVRRMKFCDTAEYNSALRDVEA